MQSFFVKTFLSLFLVSTICNLCLAQTDVTNELQRLQMLTRKNSRTPDSLIKYSQKLLDFSNENSLIEGEKSAYRFLGQAYSRKQKFGLSNNYYYKALSLAKESNDERFQSGIYNDLSLNHRNTKFYDSSLYYARKQLDYTKRVNDKRALNLAYMNMGITYFYQTKLDSAEVYLEKATIGFQETKNKMFESNSLIMLSEVKVQQDEWDEALKLADSGSAIAEGLNLQRAYSRNYNLLARIHQHIGNDEDYERYHNMAGSNRPKSLEGKTNRSEGFNEKYKNDQYRYDQDVDEKLKDEKAFYKTNLFIIIAFSIFLIGLVFWLFKKNKLDKEELEGLRKQLKLLDQDMSETPVLDRIQLKNNILINTNKLMFIKSEGHYLEFYIEGKDKPELDRNTMLNLLEILPKNSFVRIHKSYIVNISYIKIINSTKLMLKDGTWLNLSRTYKQELKKILQFN